MGRFRGTITEHFKRRWPDWTALVVLVALSTVLLWQRNEAWRQAGGLNAEYLDRQGRVRFTRTDPAPDVGDEKLIRGIRQVRWSGWVWIPRSGKFVFGMHFKGTVRFEVDGRPLIQGRSFARRVKGHRTPRRHDRRLQKAQILLEKGWHALTLDYKAAADGGTGLRLLWQPPGRRGDPEYLTPEFLRASKEEPKKKGPDGVAARDGATATVLVVLWLLFCLFLTRGRIERYVQRVREDRSARVDLGLAGALFLAGVLVRVFQLDAAGQTWDEDVYFGAGRNYLLNLLALDFRPESWVWNFEHPPVTKYIVGLGSLWSESMNPARFLMALLSSIAIACAYFVGRLFLGRTAAAVGCGFMVLMPHLVGHSRICGHESVSVALYTLSFLCFSVALFGSAGRRTLWYVLSGVFSGLCVGTRWINASVFILLGVTFLIQMLPQLKERTGKLRIHTGVLLTPLVAVAVFWVTWPRLWHQPVAHLVETFSHYPAGLMVSEPFLGSIRKPPAHYFWVYFLATVPSLILAAWVLSFPAWLARRPFKGPGLVIVWWLVPMTAAQVSPFTQDGVRYVLPALVPACLMAGFGAEWAGRALGRISGRVVKSAGDEQARAALAGKVGTSVLAGVLLLSSAWACFRVHPYYIDYYNALWGGAEAAGRRLRFEFSWWGEGLVPAAKWINARAPKGSRVYLAAAARHVMVFRTDIRVVAAAGQADYLVFADSALHRPQPAGFTLVHAERVSGVPLVKVFKRKGESR